jgi:TatD DNase family protein
MFFDSHCHLTDARFAEDADVVIAAARAAGVARLVTIAGDPADALAALALARRHAGVWATAGVHPHAAATVGADALERIGELLPLAEVVAIGETGLDYYYDNAPRERQRELLRAHAELAAATGLPLVVHSRDADQDTAALIREAGPAVRGVLHCFAGGRPLLDAALEAGWYISFAGMVSFRTYAGADLVRAVPADRLLVETDSPYLAPVPRRGRRNEPANVRHVAEAVAAIRGEAVAAIAATTWRNACAFYGLALEE